MSVTAEAGLRLSELKINLGRELGKQAGRSADKNYKGRDIGYALAAASCEGANSVDACTVTAP
jgi:hypothetical protein